MVDYQKYGGIKARDRPFAATDYIPAEGVDQTSSNSFPGQRRHAARAFRNPTGDPDNGYRNPTCRRRCRFRRPAAPRQCRFDGASVIDIVDPSERLERRRRVHWQIDPDNQFLLQRTYYAERVHFTASPQSGSPAPTACRRRARSIRTQFAQFFGIDGQPLNVRWRAVELGLRTMRPTSEQWNVVAGMQGVLRGWDYDGAFNYGAEQRRTSRILDGYPGIGTVSRSSTAASSIPSASTRRRSWR